MRVELLFDLEKPSLPADNRAIFVSFLKKTLEQSHEGHFFERYFGGTARKDYSFSIKSVYLIATRDLRISGCNFFYLKIKGLCDFLRKRF